MAITVLIAGVTASGKSALATKLADKVNGHIINADSMQVYSELRILTARPLIDVRAAAVHSLYGFWPVNSPYSVALWLEHVANAVKAAHKAGQVAIIVGGSGLYFSVLTGGLANIPAVSDDIKNYLIKLQQTDGIKSLYEMLCKIDDVTAARLKPNDQQRIIRALSVFIASGKTLSYWLAQEVDKKNDLGETIKLILTVDKDVLRTRINQRVNNMLESGVLTEVDNIIKMQLDPNLPALKAIGLKSFTSYINKEQDIDTTLRQVQALTWQYGRRQMTWLRSRMADWPSYNTELGFDEIIKNINIC